MKKFWSFNFDLFQFRIGYLPEESAEVSTVVPTGNWGWITIGSANINAGRKYLNLFSYQWNSKERRLEILLWRLRWTKFGGIWRPDLHYKDSV